MMQTCCLFIALNVLGLMQNVYPISCLREKEESKVQLFFFTATETIRARKVLIKFSFSNAGPCRCCSKPAEATSRIWTTADGTEETSGSAQWKWGEPTREQALCISCVSPNPLLFYLALINDPVWSYEMKIYLWGEISWPPIHNLMDKGAKRNYLKKNRFPVLLGQMSFRLNVAFGRTLE